MLPAVLGLASAVVPKVATTVATKVPISSIVGAVKNLAPTVASKSTQLVNYALPGYLAGRATSELSERSSDGTALGFLFDIPNKIFSSVGMLGVAAGIGYFLLKDKL